MKLDKIGLKEGAYLFALYFGRYCWECIKTACAAGLGLFLLASLCHFACNHPILMAASILAGYFLYQYMDVEDGEE